MTIKRKILISGCFYRILALVVIAIILEIVIACSSEMKNSKAITGNIMRIDPRFDQLVSQDAVLEKIAEGFTWVEGPVWNREGDYLLFSDIPSNSVFKWKEGEGVTLYLKPSGYTGSSPFKGKEPGSNGLTFDSSGRLVLCEHGDRRISRLEKDGTKTTLADRYEGKRLNSPNDAVFKSNGDLYFTDPPFGLPKNFNDLSKELPFQGVYKLSPQGKLTLLTKDIKAPNGIAFSPNEKVLYVTDVDRKRPAWLAFDVRNDGAITNGRIFYDAKPFTQKMKGASDGLKVDKNGNLFATGPGGVYVFSPEGVHLGTIITGVPTSNVGWGNDGSYLYITAGTTVYRIKLNTKGIGF